MLLLHLHFFVSAADQKLYLAHLQLFILFLSSDNMYFSLYSVYIFLKKD